MALGVRRRLSTAGLTGEEKVVETIGTWPAPGVGGKDGFHEYAGDRGGIGVRDDTGSVLARLFLYRSGPGDRSRPDVRLPLPGVVGALAAVIDRLLSR